MFSWDARKAGKNLRKHRVPFEEAATVFADPEALDWEDLEHEAVAAICDRRGWNARPAMAHRRYKDACSWSFIP